MRVTYWLNFEDYYDASQARTAKARFLSRYALLTLAVLLGVRIMRSTTGSIERSYLSSGAVLLLFVVLPEAVRWIHKLYLRHTTTKAFKATAEKEISVDIQEHGIQVVGVPNRQEWSYFSNYSESTQSFILYRSNTIEAIFPKRAFNDDSLSSFRQILKANITPH